MRPQLASCVVVALSGSALAIAAPAATKDVDDPRAWLTARGVSDPETQLGDVCCCVEVRVGTLAEAALDCREATAGGHAETADIAVTEVIRVVRRKKVVKVLDAWVGLENLDRPPRSPPWLALRVTIDPSGRALTIAASGGTPYACIRGSDDPDSDMWVRRVCASRGVYRWRGRRFIRVTR